MKITRTIRVAELAQGDRLRNDHINFSLSPSITPPRDDSEMTS